MGKRKFPFEQLTTYNESSSAEPWQIFINHRGSDVKYTFATNIHHTLQGMGYRVFLDVKAIEAGDVIPAEIEAAMKSASLHLAIFSPNYAQSPWCLAELAFILKTAAKVIPIFYHVQPSDLRWVKQGKGKYADAFSDHEKKGRYTQEKLNEWNEALHNISFHSGFEVNNNEDEAKVLKIVINCALKVFKNEPIWVAEHPIGLDELVEGFNAVAIEEEVKIGGIWGMGGSGKTTLAKELFNRNFSSFDRCSFLADVRDAASRNAMRDKQKKFLKDLGIHHPPFDSVDEGMAILANRLNSVRALIVLDDVDDLDQLCALVPNKNNLGYKSMVIVTYRELGVLRSWGLFSCIYKMPRLEKFLARQLFCWHAFLQSSTLGEFETLVEDFLIACAGLPLSLKVLGAHLYGSRSKVYWKSQLHKITRILPSQILQRLRISYDALDEEEKEMFLDVACFLIGKKGSSAVAAWDGMNLSGVHGLQTLVSKCLVELVQAGYRENNVFKEESIRMHDHLRDMGREIASKQSPYRLWWPGQIHNMQKNFKKEIPIRGIRPLATFQAFKKYRQQQLLRISNGLQILHVEGNECTEEFASLLEDVVWLRWDDFPQKNLQPLLTLRHLNVLELYYAHHLKELWQDNVDPPQLRKLCISGSHQLERLPTSIGRLQYLKMISIQFNGTSLPEEFCCLLSLEYLHLYCGHDLRSLPACFGNLINLKYIYLQSCFQLSTLPDSFKQLIHLEDLDISLSKVSTLPDGFGQLLKLESLNLSHGGLSSLPAGFGNLVNLKYLNLMECTELSRLPDSFKHLINLEHLDLSCCDKLKLKLDAFENIRKLKTLALKGCNELEDLPNETVNQTSLRELDLAGCIKLRGSPTNIGQLVNLQSLTIVSHILTSLQTSVVSFSSLKDITVYSYVDAEEEDYKPISRVSISNGCCPTLQRFCVSSCHLKEIETLPVSLKSLTIYCCDVLKKMRCLTGLASLEEFFINICPLLDEISSFSDLVSLKEFRMSYCPKVEKIDGLEYSKSLKGLSLNNTSVLKGLCLEKVEGLDFLELLECDTISAVKPCIQSLKECPRQMHIQGWASRTVVEVIVESLKFPDLESREVEQSHVYETLKSLASVDYFYCEEEKKANMQGRREVVIYGNYSWGVRESLLGNRGKGMVVTGRRERVWEAFKQLLALVE